MLSKSRKRVVKSNKRLSNKSGNKVIKKSRKRRISNKPKKRVVNKSKKMERCILGVKSKLPKKCFSRKKWVGGEGCYNPWAVCNKSVGRKS
jgi:hypothetical protein